MNRDALIFLKITDVLPKARTKSDVFRKLSGEDPKDVERVMNLYGVKIPDRSKMIRERMADMAALHPDKTRKEIAAMLGVPYGTAKNNLSKFLTPEAEAKREELIKSIQECIELGMGQAEIGRALGFCRKYIWQIITTYGLEKPRRKPANGAKPRKLKEKRQVWKWLREGVSLNECARRAKVAKKTVMQWKREMNAECPSG